MSARPDNSLAAQVKGYGCHQVVPLDGHLPRPEQLEYLDLLPPKASSRPHASVSAVAEHQGTALLYLVDAQAEAAIDGLQLRPLQQKLANRSDPAWLGLVRPGSLEIWPIGFREEGQQPLRVIARTAPAAPLFFQSLVHGTFAGAPEIKNTDYVYQRIFELLTRTIEEFVPGAPDNQAALDVLSLAGRALFFRFLIDRRIVLPNELAAICPAADELEDAFSDAIKAAQTSAWLDETFNGDFLPLVDETIPAEHRAARQQAYDAFYAKFDRRTKGAFFKHLEAILRGWKSVGDHAFQSELDWGDLDFAHIPVGVLSQVYESFSHRADPRLARQTSVHYTPRTIARLVVDEAFATAEDPAAAKVLDPACGAGIFLALSFRRLVQERWRLDGKRPTANVIRQILYRQVRGFDVSESALRLAALTLYITAIEVNGSPRPPKKLKFRRLRGEVLYHFAEELCASACTSTSKAGGKTFPLGSLGEGVPSRFEKAFDIVLGNPPWTRLREDERRRARSKQAGQKRSRSRSDEVNRVFTAIGQRALRARRLDELAENYKNPDKNPDLPFLWRATEWAKEGGLIALVLPARVFQRGNERPRKQGAHAWHGILRALSVTGLINGADLRKTGVWQGTDMPFCLLFARNAPSPAGHCFYFATPAYEKPLNALGRFRIDYEAAWPVSVGRVMKHPWLLKALSLGTWRDVEVMESLLNAFPQTLAEVWQTWDPLMSRTGQGYNLSSELEQVPAEFLARLRDLGKRPAAFPIPYEELPTFFEKHRARSAHMPRRSELYQPPLVIISQSPGKVRNAAHAYLSNQPLAFSQSYYGYSCAGHPEQETLAALLYLLPHADLFFYFCLMTSIRLGFDRQTFNKENLDALPFPDVTSLDKPMREELRRMARRLERDTSKPWRELNALLNRLYGLDDEAMQVMMDTLLAAATYRERGREVFTPPRQEHRTDFRAELGRVLEPFFAVCSRHVEIKEPDLRYGEWIVPWRFLAVSRQGASITLKPALLRQAMAEADRRAASRIVVRAPKKQGLLLGILNQRRWWTKTRARLCGQHILRHHLDAFGLHVLEEDA